MPETRSDRKRAKVLKVFELYQQGLSYRKIAKEACLSLRDVAKFVHRISNKTESPSTTSVMDEVVLEYRVNGLKRELRDLKIERDKHMNEVNDLREQKHNVMTQLRARQTELDVVKRDLENEEFWKKIQI
jgi:transposase